MDPALFGSIRYNSTISSLTPFQGNYPVHRLTIVPSANGRVTSTALDCGSGHSTCETVLGTPADVSITATPKQGYVFAGWRGDCRAAATTTVRVNSDKVCEALFVDPASSSETLLLLHSDPADDVGGGIDRAYSSANSVWAAYSSDTNAISFQIVTATDYWYIDFKSPAGTTLEPGSYPSARYTTGTRGNGLSVRRSGQICGTLTGRFVIHELVRSSNGTIEQFAADFEQHCYDEDPALYGAIRYKSTTSETSPFQGQYPIYQLTLAPSANGRITGTGVDCGSGASACQLSPVAPVSVSLTAAPHSGYLFLGWTGDCLGNLTTTTIRVNGPKMCTAVFEPIASTSPRTLLYWDSEPGDYIGDGTDALYSPANSSWTVTTSTSRHLVRVAVNFENFENFSNWSIEFAAPEGQALTLGHYGAARRYPFTPFNGLDAGGSGRGCNSLTGRFVILEFVVSSNGVVERFAADFEQHCEGATPALFGAVRYNSTIQEIKPFGGIYPSYKLTLARPAHGRITGPGLHCGGDGTACELIPQAVMDVALTATPDFGYLFTGWDDECFGGASTTLRVNGPKRCEARFEPIAAVAPRTLLRWERQPNDNSGTTESIVLSPFNSVWAVSHYDRKAIIIRIESVDATSDVYRTLEFRAPTGELLQVGHYTAADFPSATAPSVVLDGNGRFCGGGEFTVRQLVYGTENSVIRFAADVVLVCTNGSTLTVSLQYNATIDVPATTMSVEPALLQFAALHNSTSVITQPAPQVLRLSISRNDVGWTALANQSWITVTPAAGTGSTALTIAPKLLGGHPGTGTASGTITITLTDGSGTSKVATVAVTLNLNGTTQPPFGVVDTPLDNRTGVTGAMPITGWALDDTEVAEVTICRAAVAGEGAPIDAKCGGSAQIYVGNAVFIEGARPDVRTAYPTHPRSDAAGWGFLLLTNTLPNQGNGTFVFSVYARDREGYVFQLGTRTMTCDNAHAATPFGTIDTPLQGETVSGTPYVNFGWALTQNHKSIPVDGSTLMVYVDGVPVGSPSYNHHRPDIATLFPGLANSNGAVGFKLIDTTALANGLHTIVWTATDSAGATSGLGSRFFRVMNGAGSVTAAATAVTTEVSSANVATLPLDTSPLIGRRGWSPDAEWRLYPVGRSSRAVLRGEEIDRFELALSAESGETYSGYLRVGDQLRPLPMGSRLDSRSGAFTWSPGIGFIGTYDVVFVRSNSQGLIARREVRFILQPKGNGHVGTQAVIDTPQPHQDAAQPFALAGWALDADAATGTGIDTLHVWAYPLTGGAPIFLGVATYGDRRPDVAAVHGDQFGNSAFGLIVHGLTPGNYDLAVFPWSNVSGGFTPPQIVRVTVR